MVCPFPGMDPYIERPDIWPDFHDRLITYICASLQPLLKPRYVALSRERLYIVESDRPIWPDASLIKPTPSPKAAPQTTAVLELDTPAIFELWREEVRQPLIHIVEPARGHRIVTGIEVLSPDNKAAGPGRDSYFKKREEFWNSATNLVEIDLLRDGEPTVRISHEKLATLGRWHYLAAVTRHQPARQEDYAVALEQRLPRIGIPLAGDDKDVGLDLQAVFSRCWDEGPYPLMLEYGGPPPGSMTAEERAWCEQLVVESGFRSTT